MKTAYGVVLGILILGGLLFAFGIFEEADDGPIENAVENATETVEDAAEKVDEVVK